MGVIGHGNGSITMLNNFISYSLPLSVSYLRLLSPGVFNHKVRSESCIPLEQQERESIDLTCSAYEVRVLLTSVLLPINTCCLASCRSKFTWVEI